MKKRITSVVIIVFCILITHMTFAAEQNKVITNSIGMKLVRIEPGSFRMGQLKTLDPEVLPMAERR